MIQLQLYVEGQEVELFKDESITLNQSIQDVRDISKIFTDFTQTFSIPASSVNNKIFKHFYNYEILDGFDARKMIDAELHLNYRLFKKGKIKLEGTTLKLNKPDTYKITFFGNTVNLKDKIGDATLADLPMLTSLEFEYSDTNIKSLLNTPINKNMNGEVFPEVLLVPLITHTKRLIYNSGESVANTDKLANLAYNSVGANKGVEFDQLKPAIRVHAIIKAIERKFFSVDGFNFSSDFFSSSNPSYYKLFLWLHNKQGGMFDDQPEQVKFTDFTFVGSKGSRKNSVIDIYNNFFVNRSRISKGLHNRRIRELHITIKSTNPAAKYNLYLYRNGELEKEFKELSGDSFPQDYTEIALGSYTFAIETSTAAVYTLQASVKSKLGRITFNGTARVTSNKKVQITEQLPKIPILEFLTGIFKLFNLTAFIQDDKTIKIQSLDSFYSNNSTYRDVTEFVDKETSIIDSVLPYSQINFSYSGKKSFMASNYNQIFNREWGSLNYAAGEKYAGEAYEIELPFDHFMYERLTNVTGGAQTSIQWGWSADEKQSAYLPEPLLFYPILNSGTNISFVDANGFDSEVTSYFVPSNSLHLSNTVSDDSSDNLNFNAETNEYQGVPFSKSLFEKYYKTYIQDIFDVRRRLTKVKAYLPISVLQELTLADKIVIFNKVYKINKIVTNFETLLSDLELINTISETIPVIPSKFVQTSETDVTADSDLITADLSTITVDRISNFEGLDVISTNEIVPSDTSVTNTPRTVVSEVPLVVTPPRLTYLETAPTSSAITLSFSVISLGKVGSTSQIEEYGFFYSTTKTDLTSTDITTLSSGSATHIKFNTTPRNKNTLSGDVFYEVIGLSAGDNIYYRFYGITTNDSSFDIASGERLSPILSSQATASISYTTTSSVYLYRPKASGTNNANSGNTTYRIKNGDGTFFDVKNMSAPSLFSFIVPVVIEGDPVSYETDFNGGNFTGIGVHISRSVSSDYPTQFLREEKSCGYDINSRETAQNFSKDSSSTNGSTTTNGQKLTRLAFYNQDLNAANYEYHNYRPLAEGYSLMQLPDNQFGVYQFNDESNQLKYAEDGFYAFYDSNQDGRFVPGEGVSALVVNGVVTNVQTYY